MYKRQLKDYIDYMHIKDADAEGVIVPPGKGCALLEETLRSLNADYPDRELVLTMEPHLMMFTGLSSLSKLDDIKHKMCIRDRDGFGLLVFLQDFRHGVDDEYLFVRRFVAEGDLRFVCKQLDFRQTYGVLERADAVFPHGHRRAAPSGADQLAGIAPAVHLQGKVLARRQKEMCIRDSGVTVFASAREEALPAVQTALRDALGGRISFADGGRGYAEV